MTFDDTILLKFDQSKHLFLLWPWTDWHKPLRSDVWELSMWYFNAIACCATLYLSSFEQYKRRVFDPVAGMVLHVHHRETSLRGDFPSEHSSCGWYQVNVCMWILHVGRCQFPVCSRHVGNTQPIYAMVSIQQKTWNQDRCLLPTWMHVHLDNVACNFVDFGRRWQLQIQQAVRATMRILTMMEWRQIPGMFASEVAIWDV